MKNKIRIGVLGAGRGQSMMKFCAISEKAELVAVCDFSERQLNSARKALNEADIAYYTDFDSFINHNMDAVVLADFATTHAPYAVKCLKKGLHVMSEVLPCQTLKEAAELVEAVEESGKIYAYAENYCYMPSTAEMRRIMREGEIGSFEYGEGEYMHNCEDIWDTCTYGDESHWRNNMYATFYCTHSIGPLIHITGLRPVSVTGFELPFNDRMRRMGAKAGFAAVEMITLENGAIIKSLHGVGCSKNSVWYSIYTDKGRMESGREDVENGGERRIYVNSDKLTTYLPTGDSKRIAVEFDHGGSDYYTMKNFVDKICGEDAEVIDIYEALDMFLPGLFAYRSILKGGVPMEVPNFRLPEVREKYRDDIACTDPKVAKDALLPSYSKGNPTIPDEVYEGIRKKWEG